ncbi:phage integrase N-terminal SAM-like domain-containing protein [Pelosinus baikalensis]|uniref:Phage integrase N-terminal SAM-like domain-containing protein n=1 Tax=Pelosinus baikalensis TaxID=2892015 RepID=A0ABS8HZB1_9FIRM|nr:phage integrase N-terminal SAM-like domain-containing protein [Pelosinus baikalensis]
MNKRFICTLSSKVLPSSRESYFRRIKAFILFIQNQHKNIDDITETDVQQYILHLKKEKMLSAGTINNYISGVNFSIPLS